MKDTTLIAKASSLSGLIMATLTLTFAAGCVATVEPEGGYHEGYYDRDHHRWYHEHGWVACDDRDEHCR